MPVHFGNYDPSSFGWAANEGIVEFSHSGVSFPDGAHRLAVPLFTAMLDRLVPRLSGGLVAGTCWGYKDRPIQGGSTASFHSYGLAIDVNAPDNPYYSDGQPGQHAIADDAAMAAIDGLGIEWGGAWDVPKDYMHFEIHADPDGARAIAKRLGDADSAD